MKQYCIKIRFFHPIEVSSAGVTQIFPDYKNPSIQNINVAKFDFHSAYKHACSIQKSFSRYIGNASEIVSIEEV